MKEEGVCQALLTNVEPFSSHDGPGMRVSLFFKGCSLRCQWCHNPETLHPYQEIKWDRRLCVECRGCSAVCEEGAVLSGNDYRIDVQQCTHCLRCVDICPSEALKITGRFYSTDELEQKILDAETLVKAMKGGVTFTGGEPALQADFICRLAARLKQKGFHLALDTCGHAPWQNYEKLLPYMDLLLYDLKEMDNEKHRRFTGAGNSLIHDNLKRIVRTIAAEHLSTRIWIRTPLIPGRTATNENIRAIGRFLEQYTYHVDKWELCAFNNLCVEKYRQLGMNWLLCDESLISEEYLQEMLRTAQQSASGIKEVIVSGLSRRP